ncbi:hypothetical protein, partial [Streptomyces anulatus]|uniref:hypothetical protein n=1 Tax=Streptomyces anulatus TaxID=1892 RepID=UPI0036818E16
MSNHPVRKLSMETSRSIWQARVQGEPADCATPIVCCSVRIGSEVVGMAVAETRAGGSESFAEWESLLSE